MQFQRLRLTGFKSFVEPTEFRIEPGLTGIVGPNGCGKSNLLEALRWVMGANSAKAMRAGGMDDVIFAGSGNRPARNHADVALTIDNSDRTAPAQFNDDPVLEVVRRIDRGEGSTYRINGREVRARDVQLLFADASTGANSPALVRQGQISELIGAKPQNRRRILEEAAGVSGLHTRRHEAELRLRAAESNLSRLDDVARELETALNRLRREARQAEKYKRLSAEIRAVQGAVLFARWAEARDTLHRTQTDATDAARQVEETARTAAAAQVEITRAEGAMPPLREEATIAQAVLGQLAIQKDRAEREAEAAAAEFQRLSADLARIDADQARESQARDDALATLGRIEPELAEVRTLVSAAPERGPELAAAAKAAEDARAAAEAAVEQLAARAAAEEARARAAAARLADAEARLSRTVRALDQARTERAAVGPEVDPAAADAAQRLANAEAALATARTALESAEADRAQAAEREASARQLARSLEDQLGRLRTEARGLAQLTAPRSKSGHAPALDSVSPEKGYGAALAAALGDDLDAALDARALSYWGGAEARGPAWPQGAEPLAPLVKAPAELAARLAFVAVVARADGERLQKTLGPGMRLVSREGDLWRWDGFVARADAPKPAAVRLEQRTRLAEVEAEIDITAPRAEATAAALKSASDRLRAAEDTLRDRRRGPPDAERLLAGARDAVAQFERAAALRAARAQSLDETIARFEAEHTEVEAALAVVRTEHEGISGSADLAPQLAEARQAAAAAREAAGAARTALDVETRERAGRQRRLESLERDLADWTRRAEAAARRSESLDSDRVKAAAALDAAREAPEALQARLLVLLDEFGAAEARRVKASDALEEAETARLQADRAARAADQAAGEARERRAALVAHLDGARARLAEIAGNIRESVRMEPEELGRHVAGEAVAVPKDAAGVEAHLFALERERDAIGPVNLRAEEEAQEYAGRLEIMRTERADLSGAVGKLRAGIEELNAEGRERLLAAFEVINGHFQTLFQALFGGGQAELRLIESDDPLEAGLEIYACPPGKRMASMSLMSGGEQALTASALIFGVFLANPAPICVLDEVDAPLDDANVDRYCNMLDEMRRRTQTRFIAITHNPVTMSRMDRLFGVTMGERGVSQLVSVDLSTAEKLVATQ
ncbi:MULTISPECIES: AAA family ATPase [unclassified Caulobacter]|uniref:AAA family ATPase n=1 Tax=unclassified Caulobacter TaxID=2648921 RepID=UPI000D3DB643|nr:MULTISPECIES: AAA family ATPase [unclassified Caulobacter]PTS87094.1 chromosome segregation protein SMC [Caulobacter sp. HMWF009]PTT10532.1 chromosome segregation protein SMC [Caulobacter sp. HMWF025]